MSSSIKSVVFDIGNVMVRWAPLEIIRLTFGELEDLEQKAREVFLSDTWLSINKGLLTEAEAKLQYQQLHGFTELQADQLFYYVFQTQLLLHGSVSLLERVKSAGYNVYALTDNVIEIVEHLKAQYDFWPLFDGAIISAHVGCLKPGSEIFNHLLKNYELNGAETVFLDDMMHNVEGAQLAGIHAIQFTNAHQCEIELKALGLSF